MGELEIVNDSTVVVNGSALHGIPMKGAVTFRSENRHGRFIRQLHLHFPNQITLSVIWGSGTYSDNHYHWIRLVGDGATFIEKPTTVEIAVLSGSRWTSEPEEYVPVEDLEMIASEIATWHLPFDLPLPIQVGERIYWENNDGM